MKNIFEGAKFGDKFKVRNGNQAIYIESYMSGDILTHFLVQEGLKNPTIQCYDDGQHCMNHKDEKEVLFPDYVQYDIVGKWEEPIDEEKLDRLADESWNNLRKFASAHHVVDGWNNYTNGFKSGYRKAKGMESNMSNQKYKDAAIEFLGKDNLDYLKSLDKDDLFLTWESSLCGRIGMQVRNYLRNKFPEIDEIFGKDYWKIEDWSWDLINEILKEHECKTDKESI